MKKILIRMKDGSTRGYEADRFLCNGETSVHIVGGDQVFAIINFDEVRSVEYVNDFEQFTGPARPASPQRIPFVRYIGDTLHFTSPSGADVRVQTFGQAETYCQILNQIAEEWVRGNK